MIAWQKVLVPVGVCATALALASAARYGLVEPADTTAYCDGGAVDAWCGVRSAVIQAFVHQRIAWVAWALALAGLILNWKHAAAGAAVALTALFAASAGMVLYTTELCAPAALLALLACAREGQVPGPAPDPASTSNSPQ